MGLLPEPTNAGSSLPARQTRRLVRAVERSQVEVFGHQLSAQVAAAKDKADSEALREVVTTALEVEIGLLDRGRALAKGDPAGLLLVGERLAQLQRLNSRRIERRF